MTSNTIPPNSHRTPPLPHLPAASTISGFSARSPWRCGSARSGRPEPCSSGLKWLSSANQIVGYQTNSFAHPGAVVVRPVVGPLGHVPQLRAEVAVDEQARAAVRVLPLVCTTSNTTITIVQWSVPAHFSLATSPRFPCATHACLQHHHSVTSTQPQSTMASDNTPLISSLLHPAVRVLHTLACTTAIT